MNHSQLIREIEAGRCAPLYFLSGDEPWFIDQISDCIEERLLAAHERDFNLSVLYGREVDVHTIVATAKQFPMMAERRVVLVKEAQGINRFNAEDVQQPLAEYAARPVATTVLCFCYKGKTLDKRKALARAIQKNGVLFEAKKLYDDKLPGWISEQVKASGYQIGPRAALLLAEHLGSDLGKMHNELSKLFLNLPQGAEITSEHIEQYIGISKEYNSFELQDAIGKKDVARANRIVLHFGKNEKEHPVFLTIGFLYNFFSKLLVLHSLKDKSREAVASALKVHPFFAKDYLGAARHYPPAKTIEAISLLREYDMRSKGVGNTSASQGDLLKELVYRLMH